MLKVRFNECSDSRGSAKRMMWYQYRQSIDYRYSSTVLNHAIARMMLLLRRGVINACQCSGAGREELKSGDEISAISGRSPTEITCLI